MKIYTVPSNQIDYAWKDGASCLSDACVDECTPDQLKMVLSRGERTLLRMDTDDKTIGWAVVQIIDYPNMRVLFVTNVVARNSGIHNWFDPLSEMAKNSGCSRIRFAAQPAQERLYRMKMNASNVYTVMEKEVL